LVKLDGEIKAEFVHVEQINILSHENQTKRTHVYLRNTTSGYILYTLCKNGEPIIGRHYRIGFGTRWSLPMIYDELVSDSAGQCHLGALEDVECITVKSVEGETDSVSTNFRIRIFGDSSKNSKLLYYKEGDSISLPQDRNYSIKTYPNVYCLEHVTINGAVLENLSSKLVHDDENNLIKIDSLKAGVYNFEYMKQNQSVVLVVKKIEKAVGNLMFDQQSNLIQFPHGTSRDSLPTLDIKVLKFDTETKELTLKILGADSKTKIHLLTSTFAPEGKNNYRSGNSDLDMESARLHPPTLITPLSQSHNTYLHNRQIGDEILYIIARKKLPPSMGITSKKPQLLLTHQPIKTTSYNPSALLNTYNASTLQNRWDLSVEDYENENCLQADDIIYRVRERKMQYKGGKGKGKRVGGLGVGLANRWVVGDADESSKRNFVEKLRGFVKDVPATFSNLEMDGEGEVTVRLGKYSRANVRVWVVGEGKVCRKDFTVGDGEFGKKDLRLQVSKDENYCVSYKRDVFVVGEDKEVEIPNFNSCEFEFLDS
jgi:hypothetical protein